MTDAEKIEYARAYITKLANGVNPLTGQAVPEDDVINNVKISRCLFYVSDLLRQLARQENMKKARKPPFQLSHQERQKFRFSEAPIPISEITRRINALIHPAQMEKMSYKPILDWLIALGFLTEEVRPNRPLLRRPTPNGIGLGISEEVRQGPNGPYTVLLYNRAAQQFILDNLDAVLELRQRAKAQGTSPASPQGAAPKTSPQPPFGPPDAGAPPAGGRRPG